MNKLNENRKNMSNEKYSENTLESSLKEAKGKLDNWNKKSKIIQAQFDFKIPDYIIDEIICFEKERDYLNLCTVINCAIVSGSISSDNGKTLKEFYC